MLFHVLFKGYRRKENRWQPPGKQCTLFALVLVAPLHFHNARKGPDMKAKLILIASLAALLSLVALAGYSAPPSSVEQVPRLTKEQVRDMLGKPGVVILDVRYIKQYEQSDRKIPGAVFFQPETLDEFVKNHPQKNRTYILY